MREAHPLEREIGIDWYASEIDGVGGRIKDREADFQVTEIEGIDLEPLGADPDRYPYLILRVRLTGWDTFAFAKHLATETGVHPDAVRWAGTKDKTAVTTQLFSIKGLEATELPTVADGSIDAVGRFGRQLHYGDLVGNRFEIRVRDPVAPDQVEHVSADLEQFGDGTLAFPNYFGQQRFGSRRPITHRVGLSILGRDWEGAVMHYVGSPSEREPPETQSARQYIADTYDWAGGLERMPPHMDHERTLLRSLQNTDRDTGNPFREALGQLPTGLQQLFVHAAQSYLFNRIVSDRMERELSMTEAVPGDVVCFATERDGLGLVPAVDRTQRVTADRIETVNRHVTNGRAFLTAPLIGTETTLGEGEPGEIARAVLEETDLTRQDFDLPEPYESTGTRRAVLLRPDLEITHQPLEFSFRLPSGAYATVLLREYLKVDPDKMA